MAISKYQRIMSAAGVLSIVGVLSLPVVTSAVADNDPTTITANVADAIAMTTSGSVTLNVTPSTTGALTSASDTVTVSTNVTGGYILILGDTDATTTLENGANTLLASAGTQASPIALETNRWGYAVAGVGGFSGSYSTENSVTGSSTIWAGVPANSSENTLKNQATAVVNDVTTVWYAAEVDMSKPTGNYVGEVTYTATSD